MKETFYRRLQVRHGEEVQLTPCDRIVSMAEVEQGTILLVETTVEVPSRLSTKRSRGRKRGAGARF